MLRKWQKTLRLRDWDIKLVLVNKEWRKSGDIKIDRDNQMAALLIHETVPEEQLEEVVVHELLHLRLYGMDQMIEANIDIIFGHDASDPKKEFAMNTFFIELESTVENLTKALLTAAGREKDFWFNRVDREINEELNVEESN
ncbi:MAG: hypothetical protein U9P42_09025 [Candidatus Fermentibacteria bacterium]|nr:hypothetical protein [Candidatus Fermentibacteria bacterium]